MKIKNYRKQREEKFRQKIDYHQSKKKTNKQFDRSLSTEHKIFFERSIFPSKRKVN